LRQSFEEDADMSLLRLFWLFLKVNLLSTSGPASVGLLYEETVGLLLTEEQFIEAVGFSSTLPGSDALQLAMFVGHAAGGFRGALVALAGSILPPTILMLVVVTILQKLRGEAWVNNFVNGLAPAVAMLMVLVAWRTFGGLQAFENCVIIGIAVASLIAFLCGIQPAIVLLLAGFTGIIFLR
jgi:chromate transporter